MRTSPFKSLRPDLHAEHTARLTPEECDEYSRLLIREGLNKVFGKSTRKIARRLDALEVKMGARPAP